MQDEAWGWAIKEVRALYKTCESHVWVEPFVGAGDFLFAISPERALCFSSSLEEVDALEWLRDGGKFRLPVGDWKSQLAEKRSWYAASPDFVGGLDEFFSLVFFERWGETVEELRRSCRPGWTFEWVGFESIDLNGVLEPFLFCNALCAPQEVDPLRLARWLSTKEGTVVVFFQDPLLRFVYQDLGFVVRQSFSVAGAADFLAIRGVKAGAGRDSRLGD